jgi:hypothetical protein
MCKVSTTAWFTDYPTFCRKLGANNHVLENEETWTKFKNLAKAINALDPITLHKIIS